YLITGGCAMRYFGMDRVVEDVDVWVDRSEGNAEKVYSALIRVGIQPTFQVEELNQPKKQLRPTRYYLDIVTSLIGVEFRAAYANRRCAVQDGAIIPVISPQDLLKIKLEASKDPKRVEK